MNETDSFWTCVCMGQPSCIQLYVQSYFSSFAGPDNSSKPLCLGCFRKVSGIYKCPRCNWPMCQPSCTTSPYHIEECSLFRKRGAKINIPWYDKPCTYYDAILPLRVLLLKYHNPKVILCTKFCIAQ